MNLNLDEVTSVLRSNGFQNEKDGWKDSYDTLVTASAGFSSDLYPNVHAMFTSIIEGGGMLAANTISQNTIDKFFEGASHVAGYKIEAEGREYSPEVMVWEVKDI